MIGALTCDYVTCDAFVGAMAKYDNAVVIGGDCLELGGRPVFVDSSGKLYQMKG